MLYTCTHTSSASFPKGDTAVISRTTSVPCVLETVTYYYLCYLFVVIVNLLFFILLLVLLLLLLWLFQLLLLFVVAVIICFMLLLFDHYKGSSLTMLGPLLHGNDPAWF